MYFIFKEFSLRIHAIEVVCMVVIGLKFELYFIMLFENFIKTTSKIGYLIHNRNYFSGICLKNCNHFL